MKLIGSIEATGSIYGAPKPSFAQEGSEVLVYIGEAAACRAPAMARSLLALLAKAGVSARVLEDEPASGAMLADLEGYTEDVRRQAAACAGALNAAGLPTVVVLDSYDAEIIKQHYAEWGCGIGAEVVTATAFAARLLADGRLPAKPANGIKAACHDDDRLARSLYELEPVRALAKAAGYELCEMFNHGRLAKSCGTALALEYMPDITARVAAARWDDLARTGAKVLLTASPQAYLCLGQAVPEGCELVDLFEALL